MLQTFTDSILSIVYPQACHLCQKSVEHYFDGIVCHNCWKKTEVFTGNETICHKCSRFLSHKPSDFKTFCHHCDDHFYDLARSVGKYEKALSASIIHLKKEPFIARRLRDLFIESFVEKQFPHINRIIPVPLSKRRLFERGFNQASFLAAILSKETDLTLDENSLIRTRHTPVHRAGMDKKGRLRSVEKAFEVKRAKLIEGENILLVDDVFTSGATTSVCAKTLKKKGAGKVFVFTLARTR
jgi:ComF family protein